MVLSEKDITYLKDAVKEKNIVVCLGAGNSGPCHFSIQNGNSISDDGIFVVGGVLPGFGMLGSYPVELSRISSRGPAFNGSSGITFVTDCYDNVPHGRTGVPGTSFSCGYGSGFIASLISALKRENITYNPDVIKYSIMNSSVVSKNELGFGYRYINISKAFKVLKKVNGMVVPIIFPEVTSIGKPETKSGIVFIAGRNETTDFNVKLKNYNDGEIHLKHVNANFAIFHSEIVDDSFSVKIKVDSTLILTGKMYYSEIGGIHGKFEKLFVLPITVIFPIVINESKSEYTIDSYVMKQAKEEHFFFDILKSYKFVEIDYEIDGSDISQMFIYVSGKEIECNGQRNRIALSIGRGLTEIVFIPFFESGNDFALKLKFSFVNRTVLKVRNEKDTVPCWRSILQIKSDTNSSSQCNLALEVTKKNKFPSLFEKNVIHPFDITTIELLTEEIPVIDRGINKAILKENAMVVADISMNPVFKGSKFRVKNYRLIKPFVIQAIPKLQESDKDAKMRVHVALSAKEMKAYHQRVKCLFEYVEVEMFEEGVLNVAGVINSEMFQDVVVKMITHGFLKILSSKVLNEDDITP